MFRCCHTNFRELKLHSVKMVNYDSSVYDKMGGDVAAEMNNCISFFLSLYRSF